MKKCPFCAEEIQDEAIVCRYCGRDLVPNIDQAINSKEDPKVRPELKLPLSLSTVNDLSQLFAQSYKSIQYFSTINKICSEMNKEFGELIFGKYIEHRVLDMSSIQEKMSGMVSCSFLWGYVCFGVGVEGGIGNIEVGDAAHYLMTVSEPLSILIAGYLTILVTRNIIKQEEANSLSIYISKQVLDTAFQVEKFGRSESRSVERKTHEFLYALKSIEKRGGS